MSLNRFQSSSLAVDRRQALRSLGLMTGMLLAGPGMLAADDTTGAKTSLRVGEFSRIYDPSNGEKDRWYINDHTFVRSEDGLWHLFGITHREPAAAQDEKFFAHATASDLYGPWKKQPFVMQVDPKIGETVVWAPFVFRHDGLYWMYYCAGGKEHTKYHIHLATSPNLFQWTRHAANPMIVDGYDARDPMVFRHGNEWILYYAATSAPTGGYHTVKAAISRDLVHWSGTTEVFRSAEKGTYGGPTESPFVVEHKGKYYLFVCTNHDYNETAVYESDSPLRWNLNNVVGKFVAHASEVIHTEQDKWYLSRAGWGQGGVYLTELFWNAK